MFKNFITDSGYGDGSFVLSMNGYIAITLIMLAVLLLGCFVSGCRAGRKNSTRQLTFSSMAIALACLMSFLKIFHLPMGGSITLFSMLFICLVGYWYGLGAGLTAGIAYGFLQMLIDPYILSVPQLFTDYVFAFGALGLSGLFSHKKNGLILGYIAGVLGRYFFAFLSGMIFFGTYAADYNMSAPIYSLLYNGAYIGGEAFITLILLVIPPVRKGIERITEMARQ
jgi:thiamine transporter